MFKLKKNIKLAKYAGFCHGVSRAVEAVKQIKVDNPDKNVYVLGELIHNPVVINELANLGIRTVETLSGCEKDICIIRSHGMSADEIENIKQQGFQVFDLTCPDVKKVQQKAVQLAQEGFPVLILGKGEHPEVIAIKKNAQKYSSLVFVISKIDELDEITEIIKKEKKAGIVVQTTQKAELLQEIVSKLLLVTNELKIFNTICKSTALRQKEARELADNSDLMIVAGGKNSANTTHLAEILQKITKTIHIESADDLDNYSKLLAISDNIGVTAGASTPEYVIKDILTKLSKYTKGNKNDKNNE